MRAVTRMIIERTLVEKEAERVTNKSQFFISTHVAYFLIQPALHEEQSCYFDVQKSHFMVCQAMLDELGL